MPSSRDSRIEHVPAPRKDTGDLAFADAPPRVVERVVDFLASLPLALQAANSRPEQPQERRRAARYPTFQSACIVIDGRAPINCVLRNVSKTGACLQVATAVGVPDSFALRYQPGSVLRCRVVWRKQRRLGIEFDPDQGDASVVALPGVRS